MLESNFFLIPTFHVYLLPAVDTAISNRPVSPDRATAFLMALHDRLGLASPASLLNHTLARYIVADLSNPPTRSIWL
jgi:hypothetical protein